MWERRISTTLLQNGMKIKRMLIKCKIGKELSNSTHKEALCKRLFGEGTELKLDDLAMVAGGLNEPFISTEDWSDKDTSHE